MLLSPRQNGLDSLFKEVRVFKGRLSRYGGTLGLRSCHCANCIRSLRMLGQPLDHERCQGLWPGITLDGWAYPVLKD